MTPGGVRMLFENRTYILNKILLVRVNLRTFMRSQSQKFFVKVGNEIIKSYDGYTSKALTILMAKLTFQCSSLAMVIIKIKIV